MRKHVLAYSPVPCAGCGACVASCPKRAVELKLNPDGFFSAVVDDDLCVDCGICQKVCLRFADPADSTHVMQERSVYGVCSAHAEVQRTTTSGGFAYELARWGLEQGYKIMGVVYDYETDQARTVVVDRLEGLELLKGSKYIQSDTSEAFTGLLEEAKRDRSMKYICVGTPCQIFGLRQLVRRHRLENEIIYVDLFCHGVPSYKVWKPYVSQKREELGKLDQVQFRYKGNGWHQYTIRLVGERGVYSEFAYKDLFYRYFFDNVALNASCFTCAFRKEYTASDLRLGDFWGRCYEHREDGVSAVLAASERGLEVLSMLEREKKIVVDRIWEAEACLSAQSTEDYRGMELRNAVIDKLSRGESLRKVQRYYFNRLPWKNQLRSFLKRGATCLPNDWLVKVRRLVRS
ncbi:Coenzyme F420 hydrogenase/dehydrogenase, beta subunit C-terminal domain [Parabacteroides sp.]|uniref:Coenzyme F420 hydrogenase/dehydrogenase, beta subunit C-terminal domain n=1 Tax=Parabacteroides sp. TaxID=1869337 RepID=UPI00257D34A0|nr:Coenzyme F420 hydrogenase/dehydrogenase, beta subunit C-terminal domain [Parabacteroides sp.]